MTLALLLVVVVRALLRTPRAPTLAEVAVLFGFALVVCSLAQLPTPWSQVERLGQTTTPIFAHPEHRRLVERATRPGERVAILAPLGHRLAHELALVNVAPYSSVESMPTQQQLRDTVVLLRREGVRAVFLSLYDRTPGDILGEVAGGFRAAGFAVGGQAQGLLELRDAAR